MVIAADMYQTYIWRWKFGYVTQENHLVGFEARKK